jgi:hypothetical protein
MITVYCDSFGATERDSSLGIQEEEQAKAIGRISPAIQPVLLVSTALLASVPATLSGPVTGVIHMKLEMGRYSFGFFTSTAIHAHTQAYTPV